MTRSAPPDTDGARARLRARAADWGGRDDVDVGPPVGARVGWPGAPPGTPAARLRLPPRPDADVAPGRRGGLGGDLRGDLRGDQRRDLRAEERDDAWWDDDEDDEPIPAARRGSAWDPPERGERARRWMARWLPASWSGARWDPGRTGALALAAVAAVAAVVAAVGVWSDRPVAEPVPALPAIAQGAPAAGPAAPAAPAVPTGPIVVSVTGKVERPGMVRLPPGSRVGDALDAAGGAERGTDLTGLNLAQRLADGEQVVVGVPMPAPAGGVSGPAGAPSAGGAGAAPAGGGAAGDKVDLNTATLEQLDQLPGVGPVTAQKILDWRSQNGRFAAIEQLQEVSGIGEARFAQLRTRVRV